MMYFVQSAQSLHSMALDKHEVDSKHTHLIGGCVYVCVCVLARANASYVFNDRTGMHSSCRMCTVDVRNGWCRKCVSAAYLYAN